MCKNDCVIPIQGHSSLKSFSYDALPLLGYSVPAIKSDYYARYRASLKIRFSNITATQLELLQEQPCYESEVRINAALNQMLRYYRHSGQKVEATALRDEIRKRYTV
jgi:hypothetical protein